MPRSGLSPAPPNPEVSASHRDICSLADRKPILRNRRPETPATDELGERSYDLRGRLLRQVKQGHRRSIGRYRVLIQAATIRRGRRRRWLLLSDCRRRWVALRALYAAGRCRPRATISSSLPWRSSGAGSSPLARRSSERHRRLGPAVQRQLGHAHLGITSIYLQGIDTRKIVDTVHHRRPPGDLSERRSAAITMPSRGRRITGTPHQVNASDTAERYPCCPEGSPRRPPYARAP